VHLAAFDRDWNLLDDTAVTDFTPADKKQPGRPWVILHKNSLYVSYDCDSVDAVTGEEMLSWQAFVKVYELSPDASAVRQNENIPAGCSLEQNYPNPFNPATTIAYALPEGGRVRISIHDVAGRQVKTLVNGIVPAGRYKANWNGTDERDFSLPAGMYFCRMEKDDHVRTIKLTLLK
jgi:hypothetical protein